MSNLSDTLAAEYKSVQEENASSGGFKIIGQVLVEFGFNVFANRDNVEFFPYQPASVESAAKAKEKAESFAAEWGGNGAGVFPSKGVRTTVLADGLILGSFQNDFSRFVSTYMAESGFGKKMSDEERDRLAGTPLPYDAIMKALVALGDNVPLGKPAWCMVGQPVDGYQKAKGKKQQGTGKNEGKEFDHRIFVIEQVFKNKAEAQKAADQILGGSMPSQNGVVSSSNEPLILSAKALENYGSLEVFVANQNDLLEAVANANNGLSFDGTKLPPPVANRTKGNIDESRKYVAEQWGCEAGDLALIDETPF